MHSEGCQPVRGVFVVVLVALAVAVVCCSLLSLLLLLLLLLLFVVGEVGCHLGVLLVPWGSTSTVAVFFVVLLRQPGPDARPRASGLFQLITKSTLVLLLLSFREYY